jgi:hypothetical protein
MHDIEALKHDKVSAAVKCVGILQGMLNNRDIPLHYDFSSRQAVTDYMTAETALAIALDERCKDNADRSIDPQAWIGDGCGFLAAQAEARIKWGLTPTDEQQEAWNVCNISDKTLNEVMPI